MKVASQPEQTDYSYIMNERMKNFYNSNVGSRVYKEFQILYSIVNCNECATRFEDSIFYNPPNENLVNILAH